MKKFKMVVLTNQHDVICWTGMADNQDHAEDLAGAYAEVTTGNNCVTIITKKVAYRVLDNGNTTCIIETDYTAAKFFWDSVSKLSGRKFTLVDIV